MRIDIITLFPEMLQSPFEASIVKRAREGGKAEIHFHNPRDFSNNNYKQVDDYPYGGGAGMVMMIEPLDRCISQLKAQRDYDEVIYMTPDGETLNQSIANQCSLYQNLILLCGHYKGVDQRVRDHLITREISIGDFVLSGGELAAAVFVTALYALFRVCLAMNLQHLATVFKMGYWLLLSTPVLPITKAGKFQKY